jgi:hypothetical protein
MKENIKKKLLFLVSLIVLIIIFLTIFIYFKNISNSDVVENLEGQIYYTKRIDGVNTLYKSDANLQNEKLIYSHKGKGRDSYGSYNDNIPDYYYDMKSEEIRFIAMNNGDWSLFSIKEGADHATLISKAEFVKTSTSFLANTNYIKKHTEKLTVTQREGSIYIIENGEEKCIKKFYGIYDDKFTGYHPIGFSPDGKYLIYHSMEHLTAFGTLLEGFINDSYGHSYIMDLSSGKSTRFIDASNIQWIMREK